MAETRPLSGSAEKEQQAENQQQKNAGDQGYFSPEPTQSADGRILLGQDIEIYPTQPLPEYNGPGFLAYGAKDRRQSVEQVAYLCGRDALPRVTFTGSYKNMKSPTLQRLLEGGIVNWKPEARQRFALVFDRPPGKKFLPGAEQKPYRIAEDRLVQSLIKPIIGALMEFRNVDMVHGAINLENIFFSGAEGAEKVVLGQCLTAAPSMRQHAIYESIERGMAQANGRGPGTNKDDLYAFGICVAMIARGENLIVGRTEREIIYDKIENGSYGIVAGRERLPAGVSEFLRGVLNDDEQQRWDIEDAHRWLEGSRRTPKQPRTPLISARPFTFGENKFWDLRAISLAFSDSPQEAATALEKDQFDLWIKRNFEDKPLEMRLEKAWERDKSASREKLVCSICMALDPEGPVRYKDLSLFPGGYGVALALAMDRQEDLQNFGDLIHQQLINNWINLRFDEIPDSSGMLTNIEKCRNYLTQKIPGYGIERVLYTLNNEVSCMSPLLKDYFVQTPGNLLHALEDLARKGQKTESVLDRHMIAFISVREAKMIDPHLGHVISHDRGYQLVGITRTLAGIQKRFSTGPMPALGNHLISMMTPAINRYTDRDFRQDVSKRINKLVDSGNLSALLDLIDDSQKSQEDVQKYGQARAEYAALIEEKKALFTHMKGKKTYGYATGRQAAMIVSTIMGAVGILAYTIMFFAKG